MSQHSIENKNSVVKSFVDLITKKIDEKQLHTPVGKEREVLGRPIINPGIYFGVAAGVIQFAFLRKAPIYMVRRLQQQQGFAPTFQESPLMRSVSVVFDGVLSMATTCAVWAFMVDEQKVYEAAASIPLLEGRSEISDVLCDDFIAQHKNVSSSFWEANGRDDKSVASLFTFIENCQKRRAHERSIRSEQGISPDIPVSIPEGGVSSNTIVDTLVWDDQHDFTVDNESEFVNGLQDE
mmetsp:Transcript_18601/g.53635  ORF Transcript_18601/g.53635 Transcript_18601/m.53635 type:complete len:237 (+) Transcript_18601:143-853(+)